MSRTYFVLWYRLNDEHRYLLWYSNDIDGVLIDQERRIPSFASADVLQGYAAKHGIAVQAESPILHDLDASKQWLQARPGMPGSAVICDELLSAWNLFIDVSRSLDEPFDSSQKRSQRIYEKLFWGTNPPALTPPGKRYRPKWRYAERILLRKIVQEGVALFEKSIKRENRPA